MADPIDNPVLIELDDNGDVVRMTPSAVVIEDAGDTVTYYLVPKDGSDWKWIGYWDKDNASIIGVSGETGSNGERGIRLTVGEMDAGAMTNVTLIYQLKVSGIIGLNGDELKAIRFKKSFDPMIVFR